MKNTVHTASPSNDPIYFVYHKLSQRHLVLASGFCVCDVQILMTLRPWERLKLFIFLRIHHKTLAQISHILKYGKGTVSGEFWLICLRQCGLFSGASSAKCCPLQKSSAQC